MARKSGTYRGAKRNGTKAARTGHAAHGDVMLPTPERGKHDVVEYGVIDITDKDGKVTSRAMGYRTTDILGIMHQDGEITNSQMQAGKEFKKHFGNAQLSGARAMAIKEFVNACRVEHAPSTRVEEARKRVWEAIQVAGGLTSGNGNGIPTGGALLWAALGLGLPIVDGLRCHLVTALERLEVHYGYAGRHH